MIYNKDVVRRVEYRRLCRIYDAGIALTATSLIYLGKRIRENEEKLCDIENGDINPLSNSSTSSLKHAARAHVSPNKNPELSIYLYSTDTCNLFHPKKEFHSTFYDCLV